MAPTLLVVTEDGVTYTGRETVLDAETGLTKTLLGPDDSGEDWMRAEVLEGEAGATVV